MDSLQRVRRDARLALLAGAALLLGSGDVAAELPQPRCQQDALENWYCAMDEKGVAVVDNLGVVLCSPGACIEVEDEWQCSVVSGGHAALTADGPVCDGGCRAPRAVDCSRGIGPTGSKGPARLFPVVGAQGARAEMRKQRAPGVGQRRQLQLHCSSWPAAPLPFGAT